MRYDFWCECGGGATSDGSFGAPPPPPSCPECGAKMYRDYGGVVIDTSGCKDHDEVPGRARVTQSPMGVSTARATKIEAAYAEDIANKRKANNHSGKRGSIVMTHSIPTELYHGKIKQTGDRDYWRNEKNLNRHKSCKVI